MWCRRQAVHDHQSVLCKFGCHGSHGARGRPNCAHDGTALLEGQQVRGVCPGAVHGAVRRRGAGPTTAEDPFWFVGCGPCGQGNDLLQGLWPNGTVGVTQAIIFTLNGDHKVIVCVVHFCRVWSGRPLTAVTALVHPVPLEPLVPNLSLSMSALHVARWCGGPPGFGTRLRPLCKQSSLSYGFEMERVVRSEREGTVWHGQRWIGT